MYPEGLSLILSVANSHFSEELFQSLIHWALSGLRPSRVCAGVSVYLYLAPLCNETRET